MTRVLLLGYDPETVDFSDPALPPRRLEVFEAACWFGDHSPS